MKSWKNRWKHELDEIVPPLRGEVKDAPLPAAESANGNGGGTVALKRKPVLIAACAVALALVCAFTVCLCMLLPKKSSPFIFTIEINPSVTMTADESGRVTSVFANNADADVILSAEGVKESLIGKDAAQAAVNFADCAARLGYINFSEQGSALRISACTDGEEGQIMQNFQSALNGYFAERGVFALAVCEKAGLEEISSISGINLKGTVKEAVASVSGREVLFADSRAQGLEIAQLQSEYSANYIETQLLPAVKQSISQNLEKLKKNAEDVGNIARLYYEIYRHDDNPAILLKDYWEVKKYYGNELSGEFALLVGQMDEALKNYKNDYGTEITGIADIKKAVQSYAAVPVETLAAVIENFTLELYNKFSYELTEIMRLAGLASENLANLMQLPQTVEEYFTKVHSALEAEYRGRLESYENIYSQNRAPLSQSEYEAYINNIEKQYGSLSAYWQAQKN